MDFEINDTRFWAPAADLDGNPSTAIDYDRPDEPEVTLYEWSGGDGENVWLRSEDPREHALELGHWS